MENPSGSELSADYYETTAVTDTTLRKNEMLIMYESRVGEKNWLLRLAQKKLEIN